MAKLMIPPELCRKVLILYSPLVRFRVPALFNSPFPTKIIGCPKDCTVKVAPDWLLNTEVAVDKVRLPVPVLFQVAVPALLRVRSVSEMLPVPVKLRAVVA